jgi:hypothetical protein
MKKAHIFATTTASEPGYVWKWRCGPTEQSKQSFAFYYDCVRDAREHGHEVELTRAVGENAPGGATYKLEAPDKDAGPGRAGA